MSECGRRWRVHAGNIQLRDVQHQSRAQRLIQQAFASNRLPHAYIFHGSDGVGKEMFAVAVAKLLLCESPQAFDSSQPTNPPGKDACGQCKSCHLVDVGNHPDLHLVHRQLAAHHPSSIVRARKALDLGVDVIRHFVIDAVGVKPSVGPVKVFVIREADKITPPAQNALLKTLEEPPETTFLILLASSSERLLPTTRSRCQMVGFASLPRDFVAKRLPELVDGLSQESADLLAMLAHGSLGRAMIYAQDEFADSFGEISTMLVNLNRTSAARCSKRLVEMAKESAGRYKKRDKNLSDAAARRMALGDILGAMATWYGGQLQASVGRSQPLEGLAGRLDAEVAAKSIDAISDAESRLSQNAHAPLCIDGLFFELASHSVCA